MQKRIAVTVVASLVAIAVIGIAVAQQAEKPAMTGQPSIEGTYKIVKRVLPDGTVVTPPHVVGMMTLTGHYRNMNVYWDNPEGKRASIARMAEYSLTPDSYSETSIYCQVTDEIGDMNIEGSMLYDVSNQQGESPVEAKDGKISFQLPLFHEPKVTFTSTGMVAEGSWFTDHWKKVM
ncbi:MAG: hypothetical protein PVF49_09230 [Anaerolineales bacterium]|jgi:hypothetical protein